MPSPARRVLPLLLALAFLSAGPAACRRKAVDPAAAALQRLKAANQSLTADDFVKAAARGDTDALPLFLRAGMDRNALDARGYSALMAAAEAGKTGVVKFLLAENANPNLQNKEGVSALLLAAAADQPETVRQLIEANADVTLRDKKNWTALMKAVYPAHGKVVDALLATSRDRLVRDGQLDRALLVACYLGHDAIIKTLLDRGANVNTAVDRGQTPLMAAATAGKPTTVALLLARGANPRAINADGATAGILAMQRGYADLARMLDAAAQGQPVPPPGSVAASQAPAPEDAARSKVEAANAAGGALEEAWLKQKNVEPKALLSQDAGQDSDGDGFTDDEELAGGTDPNDPASHPAFAAKLRLKKNESEVFPAMFEGIDARSGKARVTVSPGGQVAQLETGERLPGLPYKVTRIRPRRIAAKDSGETLDVSELTLANVENGSTLTLVRALPANGPNSRALIGLELAGGKTTEREVRVGEEFSLPPDERTRYKVLDIRPTQVVLKNLATGQTYTVPQSGKS